MYHVVRSEWNRFSQKTEEEVFFSTEDRMEACRYSDDLRKKLRKIDKTGGICDCYIKDDEEKVDTSLFDSLFDSLTKEEKKDIIEIDGHRYIRKMWEALHDDRLAQA